MVSEFDPPELAAGLAGRVDVFHAVTPHDLRREEFGRGLDLSIQELAELRRVAHDPLIFPLRAGDADRLVTPQGLGRASSRWHDLLPADDPPG